MKRTALLNRHLSSLVARAGHLDEIVVADAGLPMPRGVEVIDLAITPGLPRFQDVLAALRTELVIEGAIWADETSAEVASMMKGEAESWASATGKQVATSTLSHADFKARSQSALAVIRTGEITPYANIILVCGVAF